jgi:deoxyribose-phosphate aldolase
MGYPEEGANPREGQRVRETETVRSLAARLEHRLHWKDVDEEQLASGCRFALDHGLAVVLCRPEHVTRAANHLAGSSVGVVTALGFHDASSQRQPPTVLAEEAALLAEQGADEVSLVAAPGTTVDAGVDLLVEQLLAVRGALASVEGTSLRVLLNTSGMSNDEVARASQAMADAGARLVQGGSFRGDRTPFHQVEAMRAALPAHVLLKWTQPVRSVETMLLCIALGVDRFNGEPSDLLADAARKARIAPLSVPISGIDF